MVVSPELSDLLLRWYGCFPSGDMALTTDQFFSLQDGVFLIGTDPDEWGEKLDQTDRAKQEKADIENLKRKITIKVKDLKAFCEGTVGWVMDRTLYIFPNGAEVPIRHTYVFHQENGKWKAVHVHYSIGVPNEEIGVRSDA